MTNIDLISKDSAFVSDAEREGFVPLAFRRFKECVFLEFISLKDTPNAITHQI